MELAAFAIFAALALASSVVVVAHRNPVYAVMSLVVTLVCLAVLFVLQGAQFLAVVLILVYTGAILVLFLFVLMLLNVGREPSKSSADRGQRVIAVAAAGVFVAIILVSQWAARAALTAPPPTEETVAVTPLARTLFTTYLLPFEIVGLLLLAAVVGATALARRPTARAAEGSD